MVPAYGPGWLCGARGDLRADRGEIENPGNPALAHAGYAIEQPVARVPVAVDRQLVWSDRREDWFRAVVGSFSAGMVTGLATSGKGEELELFREKMEAICFAVFVPFFL